MKDLYRKTRSKAARDAGLKVVFTGEGSDETFGGYATVRRDALLHHPGARAQEETKTLLAQMFESNSATRSIFMQQAADNPVFVKIVNRLGFLPSFIETFGAMGVTVSEWLRDDVARSVKDKSVYADVLDRLPLPTAIAGRDRLHQALYVNSKMHLANFSSPSSAPTWRWRNRSKVACLSSTITSPTTPRACRSR